MTRNDQRALCGSLLIALLGLTGLTQGSVVAPGATLKKAGDGFVFTEGPAADAAGDVVFTDVRTSCIHKWSAANNTVALFRADTGNANGLAFDPHGNLFICEAGNGRITVLDPHGNLSVVADEYQGRRLNQPNDLWVDPASGVYFSDPIYGRGTRSQDGEHVYYASPNRERVIRVIDDMQRPNGLIGTPDGRTLYVTDHGAGRTFRYAIMPEGTLADKTLFCEAGSDGMAIDSGGNVYLTSDAVLVLDPTGRQIERIAVPERPTNVTFAGPDRGTLFITARTAVYTLAMNVSGAGAPIPPARLPDTGQTRDTTATHGEDSDYTINPPAFRDNGDATVTDRVTGLTWQKADGGEMTWTKASEYAEGLVLGGQDDWRLPSAQELFSLMDHGRHEPALDTEVFGRSSAQYWWTSEPRADDRGRIWVANSGGGIGPHPASETLSAGGDKRFHVRCVRGLWSRESAADLVDNGDGTTTDRRTGLVWQQTGKSGSTWEDALDYAENLTLADRDDWRLPNIKELFSLVDVSQSRPAFDADKLAGTLTSAYWSSTSEANRTSRAWTVEMRYGLVEYADKTGMAAVRAVRGGTAGEPTAPDPSGAAKAGTTSIEPDGTVQIPGGTFQMGDHHNLGGREHRNDEIPIHEVTLDSFYMGVFEVTNVEYCRFLNSALKQRSITVRGGAVSGPAWAPLYCETRPEVPYSDLQWGGTEFAVVSGREQHPVVCIRWEGAAAYCNWLSAEEGLDPCYNLETWTCDYTRNGYRLPTEAEWEYAGRGGLREPYRIYPWGDDADIARANWPSSGDPYETGPLPWTTPVGFYSGELRTKAEFGWPGRQETYQTKDGSNGYGLYDMAGNVWEWCNDWYTNTYYATGPSVNPEGPTSGKPMPDGKPYRVLRSGNWYNGPEGHSRVSNRNPAHFRGPQDPNHPYYHIGFRIVLDVTEDGPRREAGEPKTIDSVGLAPVSRPSPRPAGRTQGGTWRNPWRRGQ
ncbi:MAG: DUF1566 domain-containing protein [Lentisphaerae bacterium]|nr:DUF1566 domain-containing protein [Lentisphaerota bacterium]MBT5613139.1 DUF1566 domain-containing protein [Lentisphaerota bacterium]